MKASFLIPFTLQALSPVMFVLAATGGVASAGDAKPAAGDGKPSFRTEKVTRGKLAATVNATGTLEPEEEIDVGAQVAGPVLKFGPADPAKPDGPRVDYCTPVKEGQVLAVIDPTVYQVQVNQAQAALAGAKAALKKAEVVRDGASDAYQLDAKSPKAVAPGQIVAEKTAYDVAVADCAVQEAAVALAEANLKAAQTNLDYCTIKAPVNGVIVDRRINVGQTVAANLSAPACSCWPRT